MNIDTLARASAADLRNAVARSVDPEQLYPSLGRLRSRRRNERLLAVAAAVVAAVVLALLPRPDGAESLPAVPPTPTVPRLASSVAAVTDRGLVTTGPQPAPAYLPRLAAGTRPQSLAFSPDATRLAYAVAGRLHLRELDSGKARAVTPCREPCPVAWSPDGTALVTSGVGGGLTVVGAAGGARAISLPPNWSVTGLDVSKEGLVAMAGTIGWQGAILAVGLDGSDPRIVLDLSAHVLVADARWSPDAQRILFLQYENRASAAEESELSLRSVRLDGAEGRVEAEAGPCLCVAQRPGLDVSDDGQVVLGALLVSTTGEHRPKLALYADGRLWPQEAQASAPVAFLPR